MAGEEECWEVICRSAVKRALEVLLGVPVLQEEDLTVSDAGKLAGLRITDGVGKCLGLTNLSLLAFGWISLGEEE